MFYNGPDVSVLCWHLRTASGCIYIVHRGWRSGPEHPAWEAGLEKMRTALDYVMLSSDSPSVTVLCLKLLSLFWSCSLSPDSRESVTKVKKMNLVRIGLSMYHSSGEVTDSSWRTPGSLSGYVCISSFILTVLDSQISMVVTDNLSV